MKYVLVLLTIVSCDWVNSDQIYTAEKLCEKNGGIKDIRAFGTKYGTTFTECSNGARFSEPTLTRTVKD